MSFDRTFTISFYYSSHSRNFSLKHSQHSICIGALQFHKSSRLEPDNRLISSGTCLHKSLPIIQVDSYVPFGYGPLFLPRVLWYVPLWMGAQPLRFCIVRTNHALYPHEVRPYIHIRSPYYIPCFPSHRLDLHKAMVRLHTGSVSSIKAGKKMPD